MKRNPLTPRDLTRSQLEKLLVGSLLEATSYRIDTPAVPIKLDQNESPWDLPADYKLRLATLAAGLAWNRYPAAYPQDLLKLVANYAGVVPEAVLLGPGSNYLITLVLDAFSRKLSGKMVIARPSFLLYESHCKYSGVNYEVWNLNTDLDYDLKLLPNLPAGSIVIFASPNNPVGNTLSRNDFRKLLAAHPQVMFIADEAYYEFSEEPYTELLQEFSNILLIRTFSKALGAAGLRLGYLLGGESLIAQLKKLRLPYLINQFSIVVTREILQDPAILALCSKNVEDLKIERERVYASLKELEKKGGFAVKPSHANFLLLRWPSAEKVAIAYQQLIDAGILVRNVSTGPGLAGCLRITIGNNKENDVLLATFQTRLCQ